MDLRIKGESSEEFEFESIEVQLVTNTHSAAEFEVGAVYLCRNGEKGAIHFANHGELKSHPYIFFKEKRNPLQIVDSGETGNIIILPSQEVEKIWFIAWEHSNMALSIKPALFYSELKGLDIHIKTQENIALTFVQYNTLQEGNIAVIAELETKENGMSVLKNTSFASFLYKFKDYKLLLDKGEISHITGVEILIGNGQKQKLAEVVSVS